MDESFKALIARLKPGPRKQRLLWVLEGMLMAQEIDDKKAAE